MTEESKIEEKKGTSRTSREHEIIASDRIDMMSLTNEFIGYIVYMRTAPKNDSSSAEVDLSEQETETYNSALRFLSRQFDIGAIDTELYEKGFETET